LETVVAAGLNAPGSIFKEVSERLQHHRKCFNGDRFCKKSPSAQAALLLACKSQNATLKNSKVSRSADLFITTDEEEKYLFIKIGHKNPSKAI